MINPLIIPILGICCGLLAIFGGIFVRPWFKLQERKMELQAKLTAEKAAQYATHTEQLEQRVRVLERIATDRGVELADQIELLRDTDGAGRPLN